MNSPLHATPARGWQLAPALRPVLLAAARRVAPREACGVLLASRRGHSGRVLLAPTLGNQADRDDRFALDPLEVFTYAERARRHGLQLVGFWHSHVDADATPSPRDLSGAWPNTLMLIVGRIRQLAELRLWQIEPRRATIDCALRLPTR